MKVTIEITENGYSKTVALNDGTVLIEKWERSKGGFTATDDSVKFENSGLLDETVEALESLDFDLSDLCDAIETENSEIIDDEPAITDDGHTLKKGDVFYTVASTPRDGKLTCIPIKLKYPQDWGSHGSTSFIDRDKCVEKCNLFNEQDR